MLSLLRPGLPLCNASQGANKDACQDSAPKPVPPLQRPMRGCNGVAKDAPKSYAPSRGSDSLQSRKGMVKQAAGRRGIVTYPNLLEIVGRSDGGAKARFPLRRGSGKRIPCRPFGVFGWGAARQRVLATLGGGAGIRRVRFAGA